MSAALVVAVTIAACGSSDSSGSGAAAGTSATTAAAAGTSATTTAAPAGDSYVATAQKEIDAAYKGLYKEPEAGAPAQRGKTVYVVSCGQSLPGCARPAASVKAAGKELGWTVKIVDGKFSPATYASGIKQAISSKADGIINIAIDCSAVKSALQEAKAAKIPTTGFYAFDCNDPFAKAGPSLYSAFIKLNGVSSPAEWYTLGGKLNADFVIAKTNGKAKVIDVNHPDFINDKYRHKGMTDELAKCSGCEIVDELLIPASDLGTPATVAQKVATIMQKHPEANAIVLPSDTALLDAAQSLKKKNPGVIVTGNEGDPDALSLIHNGTVNDSMAQPQDWIGWALAATINDLIAGKTPDQLPDSGISFTLIDKDHNLPPAGQMFIPTVDYKAAYKKMWGAQ